MEVTDLQWTESMVLNHSVGENDTYSYGDEYYVDLVVHCDMENYDDITAACFIIIFCLSISGNGMLLYSLVRYEDFKRVTTLFVLCLAVFDLLFTLTLPFWTVEYLNQWVFGDALCQILSGAYFVGIYGSLALLTAMTLDRFLTIVVRSPWLSRRRRLIYARVALVGTWIIGIAGCWNDAAKSKVTVVQNISICNMVPGKDHMKAYYAQLILLFVIPLVIIIVCYGKILHTLMSVSGKRKYRTVFVILAIVVAFVICWGPYHVLIILMAYYSEGHCSFSVKLHQAFVTCRILAYFHCCVNPMLFMLRGRSLRVLKNLLFCSTHFRSSEHQDGPSDPSNSNVPRRFSSVYQHHVTELKTL